MELRQIRDLEHQVGVALFSRSAHGVKLTDSSALRWASSRDRR